MTEAIFRPVEAGKTATLTASVGSVTVGQTVTWGGTPGGGTGGATLTINMRRGDQQLAPEGITFFAEVSGFDAQPPAPGKVRDARMHDIYYKWSFSDPGEYAAPVNVLPGWKNKDVAYGPFPSHVFTKPGLYFVTCVAVERSRGKTATNTVQVNVRDVNAIVSAANTVVCSSSNNFTGMPAHDLANRTTTFDAAIARLKQLKKDNANLTRLVFRGGDTFDSTSTNGVMVSSEFRNIHITSSGTSKAVIHNRQAGGNAVFRVYGSMAVSGSSISGIKFVGGWDSVTETFSPDYPTANTQNAINFHGGHTTAYNCEASGLWQAYYFENMANATSILADCSTTNWEDYGMYSAGEKEAEGVPKTSYVAVLGCRFAQDVMALQGGNNKNRADRGNRHGCMRSHDVGHLYIDVVDAFTRNGWTVTSPKGVPGNGAPADQAILRDHRNNAKSFGFFSRICGEGGFGQYGGGPVNSGEVYHPCNAVMDKAYFLASGRTKQHGGAASGAITQRNIILHHTNVGGGWDGFPQSMHVGETDEADPLNASEPIQLYNFTIINELDNVQQAKSNQGSTAWTPYIINTLRYDPGMLRVENVVVHRPNFSPALVPDAPLSNTRLGLTSRFLGYRWKAHTKLDGTPLVFDKSTLDTQYATPPNPWALWRPMPGSAAIGSATGDLVAYDDILGNVRPAKASRGAIEPA